MIDRILGRQVSEPTGEGRARMLGLVLNDGAPHLDSRLSFGLSRETTFSAAIASKELSRTVTVRTPD